MISNIEPELFENLLDNLHDGLYIVNTEMQVIYWNNAAEEITGFTKDEIISHRCADNILRHINDQGVNLCEHGCPLRKTLQDKEKREGELYLHHKLGHRVPVSVRTSFITDETGKVTHGIELFSDIRDKKLQEIRIKELEKMALLDKLTQLANREYIQREFEQRFAEHLRYKVPFGVIFLDIDHFKQCNDTYGHVVGDKLLAMTANTLTANTRPFDIFGRWGGEEFIGIIRNIEKSYLEEIADRIRILIEQAFIMENSVKLHITVSIGATMVNDDDTIASIIERADTLMYQSKKLGRNRVTVQ